MTNIIKVEITLSLEALKCLAKVQKDNQKVQSSEAKKTFSNQTIDVEEEKLALLKKIDFIKKLKVY